MAVTVTQSSTLDPQVKRLDFAGDTTYYVYRNGVLSEITTRPWLYVTLAAGERMTVEVFGSPTTPTGKYSGYITLQWDAVTNATQYRVDRYESSAWVQKALYGVTGQASYQYTTEFLDDDTEFLYRVVPIQNGNDGQARSFTFRMVRVPSAPADVVWSYDSVTGDLVAT